MAARLALIALAILAATILRPVEEGRPPRPARSPVTAAVTETGGTHNLPLLPDPLERVRGDAPSAPQAEAVSADPPPAAARVDDEDLTRLLRGEKVEDVPRLGRTASRRDDVARTLAGIVASDAPLAARYEAWRALAYAGRENLVDARALADLRRGVDGPRHAIR